MKNSSSDSNMSIPSSPLCFSSCTILLSPIHFVRWIPEFLFGKRLKGSNLRILEILPVVRTFYEIATRFLRQEFSRGFHSSSYTAVIL
jgi:hypothetical protein